MHYDMMVFSACGVIMLQGVTFQNGALYEVAQHKSQMDYISLFFPFTKQRCIALQDVSLVL
jgi:hypothetical protein